MPDSTDPTDAPPDQPDDGARAGTTDTTTDPTEARYKRAVGITLALLAVLGGWIAVLATNAGTNESRTTREATRLASQSQTENLLAKGAEAGVEQIDAERDTFPTRGAFRLPEEAAAQIGLALDEARAEARLEQAETELDEALGGGGSRLRALAESARRLSLEASATVQERITWNARASQYETVLTTLAVAIFLIGFTLVVSSRLRPPLAVPGLVLAVFCLGWAVHIYRKPIPDVDRSAIADVAVGQVAFDEGRSDDALEAFDRAIGTDADYAPAHQGRALARLGAANPDLQRTFAITDTSTEMLSAAAADAERARQLDAGDQTTTLAVAGLVAILAEDWDRAADLLEDAIEANELTPDLQLWRSAVAVAQGDDAAASAWYERAVDRFGGLEGTNEARLIVGRYLTLLEWVEARAPERAEPAARFRADAIRVLTTRATDRQLAEGTAPGATIRVDTVAFADDRTFVDLDVGGVAPDAVITVVGYERPAPGATWVQSPELLYVGPSADNEGLGILTPRACVPVEYRFDLYVEGEPVGRADAPGGAPTC
jgi:tetratricopeptide (TPR) repeat protein